MQFLDQMIHLACRHNGKQGVAHLGQLAIEQFIGFVMRALVDE